MNIFPGRASLEGLEIEIFKLISNGATPEQWKEWLRVPLEHAAARGNVDLFNKLLGAGANGSAGWRGCGGRTLFDAAAVGGNVEVVTALLLAGAQPDVKVVSCSSKRSALYTATILGHGAVAKQLVVAGADVNFEDPVNRRSVLAAATWGGQEQLVADLLIVGAYPFWQDGCDGGGSLLHIAVEKGFDGILSTLLLGGANKDAIDHDERTPLIWASWRGRLSAVKILLAAGADASIRDFAGFSALDHAAKGGHVDTLRAIVEHGADVNAGDEEGFNALHVAAVNNQAGAINALVQAGADVELKRVDGCTPIGSAAYIRCRIAMLALLQHGVKVGVRDNDGDTPLHQACWGAREGVEAAVDLLLRWGADEAALNNSGQSPAEWLDMENGDGVNGKLATQDEIERARLLLARAPADRAWRRRGWLVMLRSRAQKARIASSCDDGRAAGAGLNDVVDRQRENCKEARRDTGGGHRNAVDACGGTGGHSCLTGAVTLLIGLEMEGVFRTVVGFL